jgi:hypothetical protein
MQTPIAEAGDSVVEVIEVDRLPMPAPDDSPIHPWLMYGEAQEGGSPVALDR